MREAERENDELKRLTSRDARRESDAVAAKAARSSDARATPNDELSGAMASTSPTPGANHEEIFELRRRISNLNAELQLAEIDKEKLRQLREAAEKRRGEAEAKHANAEVEVARSRAAINRLASLESDLHRALAAKEASEEKHRAVIRASTSEAEHLNAKLAAEVAYYKKQLDRKRDKKRQHKAHAYELATRLQEAVAIAKDTASDCERAIARAKAEAAQSVASARARTRIRCRATPRRGVGVCERVGVVRGAREERGKRRRTYKSQLEHVEQQLAEAARKPRGSERRLRTRESCTRASAPPRRRAWRAPTPSTPRAPSEGRAACASWRRALKRAARDYKKLERDRVAVAANAARDGDALGAAKRENARLASAASRLEDDAKRHKEAAARAEATAARRRARGKRRRSSHRGSRETDARGSRLRHPAVST